MKIFSILLLLISHTFGFGQKITQNIRVVITNKQSESPIPGVQISVFGSDPFIGAMTDFNGNLY